MALVFVLSISACDVNDSPEDSAGVYVAIHESNIYENSGFAISYPARRDYCEENIGSFDVMIAEVQGSPMMVRLLLTGKS